MINHIEDNRYFVSYKISKDGGNYFGMGDINMYPYHMDDRSLFATREEFAKRLNVSKDDLTIVNFQSIDILSKIFNSDCHEYALCYVEYPDTGVAIKMCTVTCDSICSYSDILKLRKRLANEINIDKEKLVFISINPLSYCNWDGKFSQYKFHF